MIQSLLESKNKLTNHVLPRSPLESTEPYFAPPPPPPQAPGYGPAERDKRSVSRLSLQTRVQFSIAAGSDSPFMIVHGYKVVSYPDPDSQQLRMREVAVMSSIRCCGVGLGTRLRSCLLRSMTSMHSRIACST